MTAVSTETMRELDKMAARNGISVLSLMENAGEVIAEKAVESLKGLKRPQIVIFCGKGNNGGDGLVAARKLIKRGFGVDVYLFGKRTDVKNGAAENLRLLLETGKNVKEINSDEDIKQLSKKIAFSDNSNARFLVVRKVFYAFLHHKKLNYSLIIDAILGTGFSGAISGILEKLIRYLNSSGIPILAVDVPSGLNSTTGEIDPLAIRAKWTMSFGLPKKGFYAKFGPTHIGSLQVKNIGFPEKLLKKAIEFEKRICAISS